MLRKGFDENFVSANTSGVYIGGFTKSSEQFLKRELRESPVYAVEARVGRKIEERGPLETDALGRGRWSPAEKSTDICLFTGLLGEA